VSRMRKVVAYVVATALLAVAFLYFLGLYGDDWIGKYRAWKMDRLEKRLEENNREVEQAYMNDTAGGETPEETIEMFLVALRDGDLERATSYYELSVRERAIDGLEDEYDEQGNFDRTTAYFEEVFEKGEKGCNEEGDGCTFEYVYTLDEERSFSVRGRNDVITIPKGEQSVKSLSLSENEYTDIWKIDFPY